jgi:hypothetical protein
VPQGVEVRVLSWAPNSVIKPVLRNRLFYCRK